VLGAPVALLVYLACMRRTGQIGESVAEPFDSATATPTSLPATMLTAMFKPRFWFMSVVVIVRRLLLILVLTFVVQSVYTWLTMLNGAILFLHALTWPYQTESDNWMESMALAALATQTTMLTAYPSLQSRPPQVSSVLWCLLWIPSGLILCVRLLQRWRLWRSQTRHRGH